jgi:hypothetical protein
VTMKALVRYNAIMYPPHGHSAAWLPEPLMEDVVEWCILEYYRAA